MPTRTFITTAVAAALLAVSAAPAAAQWGSSSSPDYQEMDRNRDGVISRAEWQRAFDELDRNRDGALSNNELRGGRDTRDDDVRPGLSRQGAGARIVDVNARAGWFNTGVRVEKGDMINLATEGTVTLSDEPGDTATANGAQSGRTAARAPLPNLPAGALIGRIGNRRPFGIGDQRQIIAPDSGDLWLAVNDDHLPDNQGRFRVRITVR